MAFTKGVAQTVAISTMSGSEPTAPSGNIVAQVSIGGEAWVTATNSLRSVGGGLCDIVLTAAETNAAYVALRVSSDSTDTYIQVFYPEDAYTAARAAYIDAAISSRSSHSAADVDTELSAAHGAGSWAGSAGSGANEVTVTVTDGTTALPNISVTIRNTAGTTLVAGPLATDADGEVVFALDDGDYKAIPKTTSLYSGGATELTVASAALAVTCEMTAATIPASTDPALCTVYTWVIDAEGQHAGAEEATLTIVGTPRSEPTVSGDNTVGYVSTNKASTDSTGLVKIELIRGVTYNIDYKFGNSYKSIRDFTVPDVESYDLKSEI